MKETLSRVFVCFVNEKLLKSKPCCIYESTFQELEKQDKTHRFSYQYNFFFHLLCTSLACSPLDLTRVCVSRCCNIAYTIFQLAYNYYSTLSYLFPLMHRCMLPLKQVFMSHFLNFVSSIFVTASSSNTFHMLLLESQFLERKTDEMKVSRVALESH